MAVRFEGIRGHGDSLPKQDLLLINYPMASFQDSPGGEEMGKSRLGARKGGSAHRIRNIPKSGPPCFFSYSFLAPTKESTGFGSRWQREQRKSQK